MFTAGLKAATVPAQKRRGENFRSNLARAEPCHDKPLYLSLSTSTVDEFVSFQLTKKFTLLRNDVSPRKEVAGPCR